MIIPSQNRVAGKPWRHHSARAAPGHVVFACESPHLNTNSAGYALHPIRSYRADSTRTSSDWRLMPHAANRNREQRVAVALACRLLLIRFTAMFFHLTMRNFVDVRCTVTLFWMRIRTQLGRPFVLACRDGLVSGARQVACGERARPASISPQRGAFKNRQALESE